MFPGAGLAGLLESYLSWKTNSHVASPRIPDKVSIIQTGTAYLAQMRIGEAGETGARLFKTGSGSSSLGACCDACTCHIRTLLGGGGKAPLRETLRRPWLCWAPAPWTPGRLVELACGNDDIILGLRAGRRRGE